MKVISIQEPYATLISLGKKQIETRSWNTNYRGEIYIHASLSKNFLKEVTDEEVLMLIDNLKLNYGKIICKAKLKDCVKMTKDYIKEIKKNKQEYILGIYEEGRYAWILEEIECLNDPIETKGKLGIWEYK